MDALRGRVAAQATYATVNHALAKASSPRGSARDHTTTRLPQNREHHASDRHIAEARTIPCTVSLSSIQCDARSRMRKLWRVVKRGSPTAAQMHMLRPRSAPYYFPFVHLKPNIFEYAFDLNSRYPKAFSAFAASAASAAKRGRQKRDYASSVHAVQPSKPQPRLLTHDSHD
jgi:hypothetical protein